MLTSIFIVDDDNSFGRSLMRLLNAEGMATSYFESADSFLDSVPSGQKGIAIVDIYMPGCDGFSLMDKMHDMSYSMPVILITGNAKADTRDMAMQRGAVGFLQKPFAVGSLREIIDAQESEGDG